MYEAHMTTIVAADGCFHSFANFCLYIITFTGQKSSIGKVCQSRFLARREISSSYSDETNYTYKKRESVAFGIVPDNERCDKKRKSGDSCRG